MSSLQRRAKVYIRNTIIVNRIDFGCESASVIKHAYARDKKLTNDISKEKDDLFD